MKIETIRQTLLLTSAYVLLSAMGCGAPSTEEATPQVRQRRLALSMGPDFVVREVSAPASTGSNGPLRVQVRVCNQGTDGASTNLDVVLSSDTELSTPDPVIGSTFLGWLSPGRCHTETFYTSASVPDGAWYVGAIADSYNGTPESDETNNTRVGPLVGVGFQPDLVIEKVTVPASVKPGEPFAATVRVCNQGTTYGTAEVQLVLSEDEDIHFSYNGPPEEQDLPVYFFYSAPLNPGQCVNETQTITVYPPQEGAWYLGAVADPFEYTAELIETNNTRASEQLGVGFRADYVIREVSGPASVSPGQSFTTTVKVCNQGTTDGSTEVALVLSEDADIHFSYDGPPPEQDMLLQSFYTGWLGAGQCATRQVQTYAYVPHDGPWYLGAVADPGHYEPEFIETNNTRASQLVGLGFRTDFVIREVSGQASAAPGQPFMASVKVCNQGTVSGSTDVALVLSDDTDIRYSMADPQSDFFAGFVSVGMLQPGQCVTRQAQAYAQPPEYGAWYLGAVADSENYEVELIETNNTRASSEPMGVGYEPDFTVQAVSTPGSVQPGQPFTAKVTLCNQGTMDGYTDAALVLSEDANIQFSYGAPQSDELIAWLSPVFLAAGQCVTQQVLAYVYPPHEGAWHVGAVINPGEAPELILTNNTRASEPMGIGFRPDLYIRSVSGPVSVAPGQPYTLTATVCNRGTMASFPEVALVLSEDEDIHFSYNGPSQEQDWLVGYFYVPGMLDAGQCVTRQVQVSGQPPHEGLWHLGAVADPGNYEPEFFEDNNARAGGSIGFGYRSDYLIASVSGPHSVTPGALFAATVKVCNQGTTNGGTDVTLVLSEDEDIQFSYSGPPEQQDMPIVGFATGPLPAGQCVTKQVETSAYVPHDGVWYLGAVADPGNYEEELNETNNAGVGEPMGFGYQSDYVIREVSAPASVMPGDMYTATVKVCNQGTLSGSTDVMVVLSADTDIRYSYGSPYGQDLPAGNFPTGWLDPGQCVTRQVQLSYQPPQEGAWYVGAVADPGNYEPEFLETNNALASAPVGFGYRTDYVIRQVSAPASVAPGQPYTATVKMCNQGTTPGSTQVYLLLSEDTDIQFSFNGPPSQQDVLVDSFSTGWLEATQCMTRQVELGFQPPHDGTWYLGAVADLDNSEEEFVETNNTGVSQPIGFGYRNDYVIRQVSTPANVAPGQPFTASVKVCNQGTTSGGTDVMLVLSEDEDIQFSYNNPPYNQDWPLQSFFTGPLDAGQCVTRQVETSAYAPHDGAWYLGAVADPGNYEEEFLETNNSGVSGPFGIGYQNDYVIRQVSAPASVAPGQPYTASVQVCNQGTTDGSTDVVLVFSEDSNIQFSFNGPSYGQDWPVDSFYTGPLSPGQCMTRQLEVGYQPPHDGLWYLGAVADPGRNEQELLEGNNTGASGPIGFGSQIDYVVQEVSGPVGVAPGQPFTASVKVCNQGTVPGGTDVALVVSEDADIQFSFYAPPYAQDTLVELVPTGWLEPGQCSTRQVQLNYQPPHDGLWYLGAIADPYDNDLEFIESNNTLASRPVGFGWRIDYVIREVSGPASVALGQPFTASVKVCNQGTEPGGSDVALVVSEDSDIQFSFYGPPYAQDPLVELLPTGWLEPSQCVTRQVQLNYQPPHDGLWYLGAVADPGNYDEEFFEDNNTRASEPVGFGYQTDYVIREVSAPASVAPGQPYTATVKVCNQGTSDGGTDVQLVLSEDADIRFSFNDPPYARDLPLDSFSTGPLSAGRCVTRQVELSYQPPHDGLWYLGAVADPGNSDQEFREDNNARASKPVGFGWQSDYVVEEVSGPVSVEPGQLFTATVKVCNQGTLDGSPEVMLVLSEDADIHFSYNGPPYEQDMPLTSLFTGWLAAGQCGTQQVQVSASVPHEGLWYLGAIVDPGQNELEFREDNNTRASEPVGIGHQPDYVIREVSGPVSVSPGQLFTASVKVCNQGTSDGETEVQLVLSEDAEIHFSYTNPTSEQDFPLQSFTTGLLSPGQCRTQQVPLGYQPPHDGLWYLGAVADPHDSTPEFREDNNRRASEPVGFGYQTDYVIQEVSAPASVAPGQPFTATVKVCNQGTTSGGTDVQLVLSEDTTIQSAFNGPPQDEDFLLGSFYTEPLAPRQCVTRQVQLSYQPPQDGLWYVGAVADPGQYEPEFREDNNTRASQPIGFGWRPDYVIEEVSGPPAVMPGQPFTASVKVCNQGTTDGIAQVQLVLSEDTNIQFSSNGPPYAQDLPLDSLFVGWLGAGQCATRQVETYGYVPHDGLWYLGAVADPYNYEPELNETNNSRASQPIGFGYQPDYLIAEVSGPASVMPGQNFTATVKVCNQGTANGGTEVRLVLSEDADIRFSSNDPPYAQDWPLDSFYTGPLDAGQCVTRQMNTSAYPPHEGAWYLGAVADPNNSDLEFIETNNARAGEPMGFGSRTDFVIREVSGPSSVTPGELFTASVKVCNRGTIWGSTQVQLVLSEDTDIHSSFSDPSNADQPLSSFDSGWLAPGQCSLQQVQASVQPPHEGLWYLGAVADPGDSEQEFIETNNTGVSGPLGIGYQPDLTIQAVSAPSSVSPWDSATASVTVCNQGSVPAFAEVQLVLSEDTLIRSPFDSSPGGYDYPVGYFTLPNLLPPGQCKTQSVELSAQVPHDGIWYLGAIVDPAHNQWEFSETNNSRASAPMGVGFQEDYVIESVSGPPSAMPWQPFTASVKVCNRGTMAGGTDVQLVLSEDADIHYSWSGPPSQQDEPLNSFYSGWLEPGQCKTQQVEATAYVPSYGAWYLGAVADPGNYASEFFEGNNSRAGTLMGVGIQEDYVIREVSGPASTDYGTPFMASVTVCNQGTFTGSGTEVALVFSEDTDIRYSYNGNLEGQDQWAGSFFTDPLEPGACTTQQVQTYGGYAPHEGAWYLGAVVDPGGWVPELIKSNNSGRGGPIGIGYRSDLVIQQISAPASAEFGASFPVTVHVCNQGTTMGGSEVFVLLSDDTDIRYSPFSSPAGQDQVLDSFFTGWLAPGECMSQEVQTYGAYPQNEGTWYVGALADPYNYEYEFFENNNTRASEPMGIGHAPDLRIESVSAPANVTIGQPYEAEVTVCNQGTMASPAEVMLVLSEDDDIRFSYSGSPGGQDLPLQSLSFSDLAPGQCVNQSVTLTTPPPSAGSWHLGVVADPGSSVWELIELNNSRASGVISFGP